MNFTNAIQDDQLATRPELLRTISPATIDRLVAAERAVIAWPVRVASGSTTSE